MCDTLVALGSATADGSVILAKNSDREPNEAHAVEWVPGALHDVPSAVDCTYLAIPQVRHTLGVLLCRPFWMWGCEMGVNEAGVAIGNEAVFTKEPHQQRGLLGMDMMRLALERSETARQALDTLIHLLETYGQGGVAGYRNRSMRYHNAFIIADTTSAWVFETAGQHWAARRVRDVASISNALTITDDFDLASPRLVEHAVERGWCARAAGFSFAQCYSDRLYTRSAHGRERQSCTSAALGALAPRATVAGMMAALSQHESAEPDWTPARGSMGSVCMHAGAPLLRDSQTTCSLVAHLRPDAVTAWVTGTAAPCLSVFKPVYLDAASTAPLGPTPGALYDVDALWWRHERLHRAVLRAYGPLQSTFAEERAALQERFLAGDADLAQDGGPTARAAFADTCRHEADEALAVWTQRVAAQQARPRGSWPYRAYWHRQNRLAHLPTLENNLC